MAAHPSYRTLFLTWAGLMALAVATMVSGGVMAERSIGVAWMSVLVLVTWVKAMLVMRNYLNLAAAPRGWNKAFNVLTALLLAIVLAIYPLA